MDGRTGGRTSFSVQLRLWRSSRLDSFLFIFIFYVLREGNQVPNILAHHVEERKYRRYSSTAAVQKKMVNCSQAFFFFCLLLFVAAVAQYREVELFDNSN